MDRDAPALSGSLLDFRPSTLLHFLGLTTKTGALRVATDDRTVVLWLQNGRFVGAGAGGDDDVVEAVVAALRTPTGRFGFEEGAVLPEAVATAAGGDRGVVDVLEEAAEAVAEWEDCAEAIPSTAMVVTLRRGDGDLSLTADAWSVAVAVAAGHVTPPAVAAHLDWPPLRAWRAVKELVDAGRAGLLQPAAPPPAGPHGMAGPAAAVLTSTERPLWPGGGVDSGDWRAPWYAATTDTTEPA
ncbi:MAG: DUF4388 domain-containing protein [Actinobacteria bacterium]|nr:DUF4388 domain-containing protein [Actinomycetota bacterium]